MTTNKLLILSKDAEEYKELLEEADLHDLTMYACTNLEEARVFQDATIMLASPDLATGILNNCEKLKWLQSTWAGVTPFMEPQLRKDYVLTGVKDVFGPLMSEYVFAYILFFERHICELIKAQHLKQWHPIRPMPLREKRIYIYGTGSIGQHIAKTAKHFGLDTIGVNTTGRETPSFDQVVPIANHHDYLGSSDYIINTLPDTPSTQNLFNEASFSGMNKAALLINVGRGSAINEDALLYALETQQLRAAVLDVFSQEPLAAKHPFWTQEKLLITPHIAAPSFTKDIAQLFINNYERFLKNKVLVHKVDFKKGY